MLLYILLWVQRMKMNQQLWKYYLIIKFIHLFVEILDRYFGSVCELDVVYNFYKVYGIIDDLIIGGEIIETSKSLIVKKQKELELYD